VRLGSLRSGPTNGSAIDGSSIAGCGIEFLLDVCLSDVDASPHVFLDEDRELSAERVFCVASIVVGQCGQENSSLADTDPGHFA
jgi:hypothetical protein